jgi:hypothetical protein
MQKSLVIVGFIFLISCSKSITRLEMDGMLTGPDYSLCPCCGGVILTLQNFTGDFRIDSLPLMSVQKLYSLDFPKRIQFNYSQKDTCGSIVRFRVTDYFISN